MKLLCVLVVCALFGASIPLPAQAAVKQYQLNIPRQSLDSALKEFAKQTGLQVARFTDTGAAADVGPISGEFPVEEALRRLLEESGLTFEVVNERTIAVVSPADRREPAQGLLSAHETKASEATKEESRSWFRRLRLAQAQNDQSSSSRTSDSGQQEENSSQSSDKRPESRVMEEIIVTAQKRQERLIDTPQSVTVMSADDLARLGATQFRDFANTVPGLNFNTAGAGFTGVSMRGVSTGVDTLATVGTYVDEVPYGSSSPFARGGQLRLDVGLFDIDRVEVLRGPQGTLYGASTMGGLLKYVTKQPDSQQFGVDVQAGLSGIDHGGVSYNGALTVNSPIVTDKSALRASAFYSRDGGYTDNLTLGQSDVDRANTYGGRLDLLLTPTEQLSIRLTGFAQDIARNGMPMALFALNGTPVDGDLDQRRRFEESFDQDFWLTSATVSYEMGPATLTSISSYQAVRSRFIGDLSPTLLAVLQSFSPTAVAVGSPVNTDTDKFAQEIRLASREGNTIEWLIGAFYTHETSTDGAVFTLYDQAGQSLPNTFFTSSVPSKYEEYAGFGDLTWHLTDKFDVTGGVRYARNTQTFEQIGSGTFGRSTPKRRGTDDVFTYLANARYHFNEHQTAYVRYATGYRPGGPNWAAINPATGLPVAPESFEADRLKSTEVGFKAETADRRFGLDVAAYYIDWDNVIVTLVRSGFAGRINAPDGATVKGAELTATARPSANLALALSSAYQHTSLNEAIPSLGAAKGERLPDSPRWTGSLSADYTLPVTNWRPTIGAMVRYVDDRPTTFRNSTSRPYYRLPDYTIVDARAAFAFGDTNVQFYVHNLFDRRGELNTPLDSGFPLTGPIGISILQPRTYGVTLLTTF